MLRKNFEYARLVFWFSFSLMTRYKSSSLARPRVDFLFSFLLFLRFISNKFSLYSFFIFFWLPEVMFLPSFMSILLLLELRLGSFWASSLSSFFYLLLLEWELRLSFVLNISILCKKVLTLAC